MYCVRLLKQHDFACPGGAAFVLAPLLFALRIPNKTKDLMKDLATGALFELSPSVNELTT